MNAPNWNLLPHNPQDFFGLEDQFDRKDLKRAYNRLLKKYKPERHPEEFKKLRSAFEDLEEQLRYGRSVEVRELHETYQWHSPSTVNDGPQAELKGPPPLTQQLTQQPVKTVYAELSGQADKSPYDFYALALMSDLVQKDKSMFFRWLATGLKGHPTDLGLSSLLRAHLASPNIPIQSLSQTLLTFSKVVNSDEFYFFTERAWKRLLRETNFATFQKTLAACESNLKSFAIQNRLTFYLTMLRVGIWKADPEWAQSTFDFLDENSIELGPFADYEMEFVRFLVRYKKEHASIIDSNATRKDIHEAIVAWCDLPSHESDPRILSVINRLGDNGKLILNAFPVAAPTNGPQDFSPTESMFMLWEYICNDVAERNGIVLEEENYEGFVKRLYQLMKDLENDWDDSWLPLACHWGNILVYPLISIPLFYLVINYVAPMNQYLLLPGIILVLGLLVAYHLLLRPITADRLVNRLFLRRIFGLYATRWRSRFIQLIEASGVTSGRLQQGLYHVVTQRHQRLNASTLLCEYIPNDVGLSFFASVNQFRQ